MAAIQPIAQVPWVDNRGYLTITAVQFMTALQQSAGGAITIDSSSRVSGLGNYRSDQQASAAGVPRWGFYMNGSVLQVQKDFP